MNDPTISPDSPKSELGIASAFLVAGGLLRVISFHYSANTGGDAWARVGLAAEWLKHPTFKVIYDAYPPGHFWLIGLFALIFRDVAFAGRFLSLVLGIASLYPVWRLARSLYGATAALASLAVFCFYSLHIGYSTTSSAEVSYLFFVLLALMLFFGYLQGEARSLGKLALAGICLSVAESIRLEAWAIGFGLGIILIFFEYQNLKSHESSSQDWLRPIFVLGLTAGAWPLFSMTYSWIVFHDPMVVLSRHNALITGWFKTKPVALSYELAVSPGALLLSLSPLALLAALYGFWRSWKLRLGAAFAALVLFFALIQNYEIASGKLLAMARYTLTLGAMLAVMSGYGFEQFRFRFLPVRKSSFYTWVVVILVANLALVFFLSEGPNRFAEKFASVSPRLRYAPRIAEVGSYLHSHMGPEDSVVIDNYNEESNVLAQAAGLPLIPGRRGYLANTKNDLSVVQYIAQVRPRFLVYSEEGSLQSALPLPPGCGTATIDDIQYQCGFSNKIYRVYELTYAAANPN